MHFCFVVVVFLRKLVTIKTAQFPFYILLHVYHLEKIIESDVCRPCCYSYTSKFTYVCIFNLRCMFLCRFLF